jgi:predicted amidophosphoribosyltransferase
VNKPGKIKNKKILLVDDVFTTGATVNECARVLLRCQAFEVVVFTFARAIDDL